MFSTVNVSNSSLVQSMLTKNQAISGPAVSNNQFNVEENHRIWGAWVSGWGARKDRQEKSFELMVETKYGGTVTNVKRKRVPGGGSSYSKTTRTKAKALPFTLCVKS